MIAVRRPAVRSPVPGPSRFRDLWTVILAAGGARRFGRNKLLLQVGGESLLRRAVRMARRVTGPRVLVVLGADASQLAHEVRDLGASVVVNRRWRDGMAGSLRAGVAALPGSARAVLVTLADQYAVGPEDLERLARAWSRAPRTASAAAIEGRLGAPAILPRHQFTAVQSLQGDQGARVLLRAPATQATPVALPAAGHDLDAPDDLAHFRRLCRRVRH